MLTDPLFLLVVVACLAVAVILLMGISGFGKAGEANSRRSNLFMRYRIYAQAIAIVLILVFVFFRRTGG
ncbi:twin transmembrane helix small protein [Palleronia rufa]|uniref:twin transmembrane helix small protein n=1 Tax=Palleronia rufa TaxID=1530186 RepID=UPI00055C42AD|nr:twin transmembrane helix small protein [Palleronia rufa]